MKGDFSRITFDRTDHYSGVRWQQGRPTTDADHNEAAAIATYRVETEAVDVIGQSGAPREAPGFALAFGPDGALTIGPGRYYVDGILCEQEQPVAYTDQPHLPDPEELTKLLGNAQVGLVYLEVFQRHLTFQNDDGLRDVALNGVDTTTRLQTIWQVKLLPLPAVNLPASARATLARLAAELAELDQKLAEVRDPRERAQLIVLRRRLRTRLVSAAEALGIGCDSVFPEWAELIRPPTGALSVSTVPGGAPTDPCDVPPGGGYTRGENQFYIVEVHTTPANGGRNGATFKWSRDNGSVVSRITAVGNATSGSASGTVFDVDIVQRDDYLGIQTGDLVEYVDDGSELNGRPGLLRRVANADVNLGRITLDSSLPVNLDRTPRLRKWDQGSGAAVPMNTDSTPILLEHGLQVLFADGTYRSGDYWHFAARAATGTVDAPAGPQPPDGMSRHYARLGLIFSGREQLGLIDCRRIFPPLTDLTADDVAFDNTVCELPNTRTVQDAIEQLCAREGGGGTCTLSVSPGATWFEVFDRVPANGDAEICFAVGLYELADTLVVEGKGHLRLQGAGNGTRIVVRSSEAAITFRSCDSVTLNALTVTANGSGSGEGLRGAITCEDCAAVTLEAVTLRCAAATIRSAACLRVINNPKLVAGQIGRGTVDLRNARLDVGHNQIGVLIVNASRVHVDNAVIRCVDGRNELMRLPRGLLENRELLSEVRRVLYSDVQPGETNANDRLTLTLGRTTVNVRADLRLVEIKFFDQLTQIFSPEAVRDLSSAEAYLSEAVDAVLLKPETISTFVPYFERLVRQDASALYQGVTVGGEVADEVRVSNTTIVDALQGIHIGQSQAGERERLGSGTVHISSVTIGSRITPSVNREAYGIFVGNCASLLVEGNRIERTTDDATEQMAFDGIFAAGQFGRRVIIRHNQTERFRRGIFVDPGNKLPRRRPERALAPGEAPLWLVADNTGIVEVTSEWVRVENNVS